MARPATGSGPDRRQGRGRPATGSGPDRRRGRGPTADGVGARPQALNNSICTKERQPHTSELEASSPTKQPSDSPVKNQAAQKKGGSHTTNQKPGEDIPLAKKTRDQNSTGAGD